MPTFDEWLAEFEKNKEHVTNFPDSETHAVHSIRRYFEKAKNCLWEAGLTYTGRVVVRSGRIGPDGIKVNWNDWETLHQIEVPKK